MNVMRTVPSLSTVREISSTSGNLPPEGRHVRPVRLSVTSNPAPTTLPLSSAFPIAVETPSVALRSVPPDRTRLTRAFRTRTPTAPLPSTRGWMVATPRGTMKAVLTGSPGFAFPPPNDQETSLPLSSRRIALKRTGLKPGASASASVLQLNVKTSPRFTSMRGKPLTHQSASPAWRTSKPPSERLSSLMASLSRAHVRGFSIVHVSSAAANAMRSASPG